MWEGGPFYTALGAEFENQPMGDRGLLKQSYRNLRLPSLESDGCIQASLCGNYLVMASLFSLCFFSVSEVGKTEIAASDAV
jgi:hypothetical protein